MAVADCQRVRRRQSEGLTNEGKKKGNKMMKKKRIQALTALTLAIILAFIAPAKAFADAKPKTYISDVMVGMGETADEAKKALTSAGYTVLNNNLNEGGGSSMKTEKFVYLGYKTTADASEAITDLAVMNMNGGYSFSDYQVLMDKYRDSQIKPFVDGFMTTINEFRENYRSENEGNKAKADYAYSILTHIIEDDADNNMGDLLLNPTKEELGLSDKAYKALSAEEKKKTVNLTTALMQGNSDVIFLMEQALAMAADTNDTTWLERLSDLGPDGLMEEYAAKGIRPNDANNELAALYNDSAKIILNSWDDLRSKLLGYEAERANDTETSAEEPDFSDLVKVGDIEVPDDEDITPEDLNVTQKDVENLASNLSDQMETVAEGEENLEESRIALLYAYMAYTPYGEGTLLDFFTKPSAEVSGANISALYPMVSCFSPGQLAGLKFLPLELLLMIGAGGTDVFLNLADNGSDLEGIIEATGNVSVYLDVNREIFDESVAMTSKALRSSAGKTAGWMEPDKDLMGLSKVTTLTWAASAIAAVGTGISVFKYSSGVKFAAKAAETLKSVTQKLQQGAELLTSQMHLTTRPLKEATLTAVQNKGGWDVILAFPDIQKRGGEFDSVIKIKNIKADTLLDTKVKNITDLKNKVTAAQKNTQFWHKMEVGLGIVFAVLILVSISLTIYDLYRYYNITYTPIPRYIVDEADITVLDADGNQLVVRNDTAYYRAVSTNRSEKADQYSSLKDYADLNGDAGQEWLALYYAKNDAGDPILADSFKVVTGSTDIPSGYKAGIHMFGSGAAQNLTDSRYTYNDKLNGIYVYFKTDSAAAAVTATAMNAGTLALVGFGGLSLGGVLGAVIAGNVKRKKEEPAAA